MTDADRALYAQFQQLKKELTAQMTESQERYQLLLHRLDSLERSCFAGRPQASDMRQSSAAYARPPADAGLLGSPFAGPAPAPRYGAVMKRPVAMTSDRIHPFRPTVLSTANLSAATSAPAPLRATAEALAKAVPEGADVYPAAEVTVPTPPQTLAQVRAPSFPTVTRESVARKRPSPAKASPTAARTEPAPKKAPRWPAPLAKRPAPPPEEEGWQSVSAISGATLIPFIKEYNALFRPRMGIMDRKNARDAFLRKYRIRGFLCLNAEERMRSPEAPPLFADTETAAAGDFWALPLSAGHYAVVPNHGLHYDARRHNAGGMKEVFDSNFQGGNYARIRVLAPAFFGHRNGEWQLGGKGSLQLG